MISKVNLNNIENKLISIDVKTRKTKDIYTSKNLITDVSVINGKTYFASFKNELNKNMESYCLIDGRKVIEQEISKIYLYK